MYHFTFPGQGVLLFSSHAGGYEGVLRSLPSPPDVAILGCVGRANLNGVAFQGSIAEFLHRKVEWIGQPRKIIWCLHDEAPLAPWRADVECALLALAFPSILDLKQRGDGSGRGEDAVASADSRARQAVRAICVIYGVYCRVSYYRRATPPMQRA